MSFKANFHQLSDMQKSILRDWQSLTEIWQDQNAKDFQQEFTQAIERNLKKSLEAINDLDDIFSTIVDNLNDE